MTKLCLDRITQYLIKIRREYRSMMANGPIHDLPVMGEYIPITQEVTELLLQIPYPVVRSQLKYVVELRQGSASRYRDKSRRAFLSNSYKKLIP